MISDRFFLLGAALSFSAALLLCSAGVAPAALSKEDSVCRKFLGTKVKVLADTIMNEGRKCNQDRARGRIDAGIDCSDPDSSTFPGLSKVEKAAGRVADIAAAKCSKNVSTPSANGYASCPTPCDTTVPTISTYSDVAACLVCLTKYEAGVALDTAYGADPAIQGDTNDAWKCQNKRIGSALRTYVKKRIIEQQKCQYKEDREKIGATDCQTADLNGRIEKALTKLEKAIAKCSDEDLAALTSCSMTSTADEFTCISAAGVSMADALFADVYPEPSAPDDGCALNDNTTATANVNPNGCAVLARDTSACEAARTAAGLTGFWLKFSCRVTLSQTAGGINAVADGQPDYKSNYFAPTDACYESYTGGIQNPNTIVAQSYSITFPASPNMAAQSMMGGVVGLALNGVPIFGNFAAPGDDIYQEAQTFDRCGAHPQQAGQYHYHGEPYAISYDDWNFIGVMRDGYPVYGRRDPDGSLPTLDMYGGHTGVTVDSPNTPVYHYHLNEQTSTNAGTVGQMQWFLTTGTYRGTPGTCSGCN